MIESAVRAFCLASGPELWRRLIEVLPHPAWVSAATGADAHHNALLLAYTGLPSKALGGRGWLEMVHPHDRDKCLASWSAAVESGQPQALACRLGRHDGTYRWHAVRVTPLRNGEEAAAAWLGTATDIHDIQLERERLERLAERFEAEINFRVVALREREALYQALASATPDLIHVRQGAHIVYANPASVAFFGVEAGKGFPVQTYLDRLHPDDRDAVLRRMKAMDAGDPQPPMDVRLRGRDGSYAVFQAIAVHISYQGLPAVQGVFRNVTRGREAERALAESEQRYRSLVDSLPDMIFLRRGQRILFANPAARRMTGVRVGEAISLPKILQRVHADDQETVRERIERVDRGEPVGTAEFRFRMPDGTYGWIDATAARLELEGQHVVQAIMRDATKRRNDAALLDLAMKSARTGWWSWVAPEDFVRLSDPLAEMLGLPAGTRELNQDCVGRFFSGESEKIYRTRMRAYLKGGPAFEMNACFRLPDGTRRWFYLSAVADRDDTGRAVRLTGIARDISEGMETERRLRQYGVRVRRLLRRAVTNQEEERRRLAAELHDEVGQNLTALGISAELLWQGLSDDSRKQMGPRIDDIRRIVNSTVDSIRSTVQSLRPSGLDAYGLSSALVWHAKRFGSRTGLDVQVHGSIGRLPAEIELALFRVAQEALSNAARYGRASHVVVSLVRADDAVQLGVEDNGRGLREGGDPGAAAGGTGLTIMHERIEAVGGALNVESGSKGGVRVLARVPVPRAD